MTLLATGGAGALYARTTNPPGATGDGIAMARDAGAGLRDMEFVQFHPTALARGERAFLISEAVRGEGAYLVDDERSSGSCSTSTRMPSSRPRDVVASAIHARTQKGLTSYLTLAHLDPARVRAHFPNLVAGCRAEGLDLTTDLIPVAPAAHYLMGGIATDLARGLERRRAVRRAASAPAPARTAPTGSRRTRCWSASCSRTGPSTAGLQGTVATVDAPAPERTNLRAPLDELRRRMWLEAGPARDAEGLQHLLDWLHDQSPSNPVTVAERRSPRAALARTASVGSHIRTDEEAACSDAARRALIAAALAEDVGSGDITTDAIVPAELQRDRRGRGARARRAVRPRDRRSRSSRARSPGRDRGAGRRRRPRRPRRRPIVGDRHGPGPCDPHRRAASRSTCMQRAARASPPPPAATSTPSPATRWSSSTRARPRRGCARSTATPCAAAAAPTTASGSSTRCSSRTTTSRSPAASRPPSPRSSKTHPAVSIELEVDTLDQLDEALACGVETVLLDNMPPQTLRAAVRQTAGRARLEASGGITLETIAEVAATGVDAISIGALTHSVSALDIALEVRSMTTPDRHDRRPARAGARARGRAKRRDPRPQLPGARRAGRRRSRRRLAGPVADRRDHRRRRDRLLRRPLHGRDRRDPLAREDRADPRPRRRLLACGEHRRRCAARVEGRESRRGRGQLREHHRRGQGALGLLLHLGQRDRGDQRGARGSRDPVSARHVSGHLPGARHRPQDAGLAGRVPRARRHPHRRRAPGAGRAIRAPTC